MYDYPLSLPRENQNIEAAEVTSESDKAQKKMLRTVHNLTFQYLYSLFLTPKVKFFI